MEIKGQGKITLLCSSISEGSFSIQKSSQLQSGAHMGAPGVPDCVRVASARSLKGGEPSRSSLETGEIHLPRGEQVTPSQRKAPHHRTDISSLTPIPSPP